MSRIISPSQIGTFEDCNRFWWFERIMRLAQPPGPDHFTFGTVLHAVNERYLSASSNGRVPEPSLGRVWQTGPLKDQVAGDPVNLYPSTWETTYERDGSRGKTVTPTEARFIKKLVTEAIEKGILVRSEGTQVERKLFLPVIEGVNLTGYIDVYRPQDGTIPLIEDHKSYGKGSVRYLKRENSDSPNFLGSDQQLKTYAWATSELDGYDGDVKVQHNQFPKFPGKSPTSVEATITAEEIEEHGEYIRDVAARMVRVAAIKKWDDVPGPKDTGKCDRWYGHACPHHKICGRMESPEQHKVRVSRLIESQSDKPRLDLPLPSPRPRGKAKGGNNVSIFDKAKKAKAARGKRKAKAGSAKAKAAVTPVNGGDAPAEATVVVGGAPWANPECRACKGRGLTSKGKACPICDNTAKKGSRPTSMSYVLELDDAGLGVAVARSEFVEELEAAGMDLEWIEEDAQEAAPEPAPEPPAAEAPSVADEDEAQEAAGEEPETTPEPPPAAVAAAAPKGAKKPRASKGAKKGAGRPTVGLTIMVGAAPLRGAITSRTIVMSAEVLARFGAELATDMGAESYYDLETFKRRERLAQKADYIVSELGRVVLVHPGVLGNDDVGSLVQALMAQTEGIDSIIVGIS